MTDNKAAIAQAKAIKALPAMEHQLLASAYLEAIAEIEHAKYMHDLTMSDYRKCLIEQNNLKEDFDLLAQDAEILNKLRVVLQEIASYDFGLSATGCEMATIAKTALEP